MAKVEGSAPGQKVTATAAATALPAAAPDRISMPADAVKVQSAPPRTETERQQIVVEAAKAAQMGPGVKGAEGQGQEAVAPGKAGVTAKPRGALEVVSDALLGGSKRIWTGLARIFEGNHPVAAIGRGALRMVPFAGVIPLAHDTLDAQKTLTDPKAPLWKKALVGVKAVAGAGAVGAAALLVVTGAGAFLPWALGAGAVALAADVAISRYRNGTWGIRR